MDKRAQLRRFITLNIILALMPIADVFFLVPSRIVSGGLYGLAIVIMHFFGLEANGSAVVSLISFALEAPLLAYAYVKFSKDYFNKTAYATLALPMYMFIMDRILKMAGYNFGEYSLVTASICGSIIQGVGIGLIMGLGGSTGGTDIIAKIVNTFFPWISLGYGVILANVITIMLSSIMFGLDRGLAAVFSVLMTGWAIDFAMWMFFSDKKKEDLE